MVRCSRPIFGRTPVGNIRQLVGLTTRLEGRLRQSRSGLEEGGAYCGDEQHEDDLAVGLVHLGSGWSWFG